MSKFKSLPKRIYAIGDKKMVSWRLPEILVKELDRIAEASGWSTTDVVLTALDQFVQWEKKSSKVNKGS